MARPQTYVAEEQTPLLANGADISSDPRNLHRHKVVVLSFLLFFLFEIGAGLSVPATNVALEDRICHEFYPDRHGGLSQLTQDDMSCKHPSVQGRLAMIRGWQTSLDCIPGLSPLRMDISMCLHSLIVFMSRSPYHGLIWNLGRQMGTEEGLGLITAGADSQHGLPIHNLYVPHD